jgi:hypothetical protein
MELLIINALVEMFAVERETMCGRLYTVWVGRMRISADKLVKLTKGLYEK